MKLGEIVTSPGLEDVSLCGISLYCLHVPGGVCGRTGSEVSTNHIFPQNELAAIILVGVGAGDGEARV